MTSGSTCYMCDAPKTSREHAPPLCFFPEAKSFGRNVRRNLITVPSCTEHNSQRSKDDEFFRAMVLMAVAETSEVGRFQFFQKHLRGVRRRPHAYRDFFKDRGKVSGGRYRALQIDRRRFEACVDKLARALFFDAFGAKWKLPIAVTSPTLFRVANSGRIQDHQPTLQVVNVSKRALAGEPIRGESPDVFKYRVQYIDHENAYALAAIFYDAFEVFAFSSEGLIESAV